MYVNMVNYTPLSRVQTVGRLVYYVQALCIICAHAQISYSYKTLVRVHDQIRLNSCNYLVGPLPPLIIDRSYDRP